MVPPLPAKTLGIDQFIGEPDYVTLKVLVLFLSKHLLITLRSSRILPV